MRTGMSKMRLRKNMSFGKSLRFDLINGIVKCPGLLAAPFVVGSLLFLQFFLEFRMIRENISAGDALIYIYGGMEQYVPSVGNGFQFPIRWLFVTLFGSYLVLNYPVRDLKGFGRHVLVTSASRSGWWFSKCIWCAAGTMYYHCCLIAVVFILSFAVGIPCTGTLNEEILFYLFHYAEENLVPGLALHPSLIIGIVMMFVSLNLIQLTLLLFMKPVLSFVLICILIVSSAYMKSPLLAGNYTMMARSSDILVKGLDKGAGILTGAVLCCLCLLIGQMRFRKIDIL